ncbi:uncharacterized protein G2W53_033802 [Senna tora]|uniref:Uncharacterized protein n=1 Tax=Senna tora TaxID=362788 RepID=A0A834WBB9_9FABA|nr:uncharacterized protein G2W53_033802 [Senna tora]
MARLCCHTRYDELVLTAELKRLRGDSGTLLTLEQVIN